MRKIELYLVTVVGVSLLMMFGCADKHRPGSAEMHRPACAESHLPLSDQSAVSPVAEESPESPVERTNLGPVVFECFTATDKHPAFFQFISNGHVAYKRNLDLVDSVKLLTVESRDSESSYSKGPLSSHRVNSLGSAVVRFGRFGAHKIAVESKSGGHFIYLIFTVSKHPRQVASLESESELALLKVGRRVHLVNYVGQDCGARGGGQAVTLGWNGKSFVLDTEAMRLPPPTKDEIESLRCQFKEQIAFNNGDEQLTDPVQCELVPDTLELYYQGRGRLAKRIFNQTWPRHRAGRREYWRQIMEAGAQSEYWSRIIAMNK